MNQKYKKSWTMSFALDLVCDVKS